MSAYNETARALLDLLARPGEDWMDKAACLKTKVDMLDPATTEQALAVCATCRVRAECDQKADEAKPPMAAGAWGGRWRGEDA